MDRSIAKWTELELNGPKWTEADQNGSNKPI